MYVQVVNEQAPGGPSTLAPPRYVAQAEWVKLLCGIALDTAPSYVKDEDRVRHQAGRLVFAEL